MTDPTGHVETPAPPVGETAPVSLDIYDGIALITLMRPDNRNALTLELRLALEAALDEAENNVEVSAIVLAGKGKAFCSGGDVRTMEGMTREAAEQRILDVHRLPRKIATCSRPVLAAVDGICAGAGLSLAAICDVVVAGEGASFRTAFEKVGLMPDLGAGWSIPRRIGLQAARQLFLFGGNLDASEAHAIGLADVLATKDRAVEEAVRQAKRLAETAPSTIKNARNLLALAPNSLEQVLDYEAKHQPDLYLGAELQEGLEALRERRAPQWPQAFRRR